jgi:acetoin utilization protein AcuB
MNVSMWMSRDLVTIGPHTPITEAAALMSRKKIRRLPVVEAHSGGHRLLGIVSATEIYRAYPPNVNPFGLLGDVHQSFATAAEIMNGHPVTTTPEAPIEDAARVMQERKIGELPVLQDALLVGLVTESDIFRAFVSFFDVPPGGMRITFDVSKGEDILEFVIKAAVLRKVQVVSFFSGRQHDRPVCVVQVAGANVDEFANDLWNSGHHVLNVLRSPDSNKA